MAGSNQYIPPGSENRVRQIEQQMRHRKAMTPGTPPPKGRRTLAHYIGFITGMILGAMVGYLFVPWASVPVAIVGAMFGMHLGPFLTRMIRHFRNSPPSGPSGRSPFV